MPCSFRTKVLSSSGSDARKHSSLCLLQRQRIIAIGGRLSHRGLSHLFIFIISSLLLDNETIHKISTSHRQHRDRACWESVLSLSEPLGGVERNDPPLPQTTRWPWKLRPCTPLSFRVRGHCLQTWTPYQVLQSLVFKIS